MSDQSATRRQLEAKVRELLPRRDPGAEAPSNPLLAGVGLAGLFSGYAWGWVRGRRRARRKR